MSYPDLETAISVADGRAKDVTIEVVKGDPCAVVTWTEDDGRQTYQVFSRQVAEDFVERSSDASIAYRTW